MPKIEISFDEMITLTAACQLTAESLASFPDLAAEYKAMRDVIHERFAAAETQERFEERCRQYALLPDAQLPDICDYRIEAFLKEEVRSV